MKILGKINFFYFGIFLIIAVAAFLRLWNLGSIPPGLTWDEAALGYNGYSLMATGRDEYGTILPLNLKSFGDYKPAVYAYLTIPFIAINGLNEWSVRLPAALAGVACVYAIYLLIFELFQNRKSALLAGFFAAISPLAIHFSRPAFETSLAFFLNIVGTLLFLKSLKNRLFLTPAFFIFGLSLFTYQASRMFVPILILTLFILFRDKIKFSKNLLAGMVVFIIFLSVLVFTLFFQGQSNRLASVSYFSYQRSEETINQLSYETGLPVEDLRFRVLHGEWFEYIRGFFERYLIYFSPKMLFIEGDYNVRHRVPDMGVLYYVSMLLIPLGFYKLFTIIKIPRERSAALLVLLWLFIAPLPAVLSKDLISFIRGFNLTLPLVVLEAAGFYFLLEKARNIRSGLQYIAGFVLILLIGVNSLVFWDRYFIHLPQEYSHYWLYGYREVISELRTKTAASSYEQIIFDDSYGQPYIYYLFYTQYPPEKFQEQATLDQPGVDVGTVRNIDNIEFRKIYWPKDRELGDTLFLGTYESLPEQDLTGAGNVKEIKFLNGLGAFRVVESKE